MSTTRHRLLLFGILLLAFAARVWLALPNPTPTRFWDERWAIENLESLLVDGRFVPANGFYPSLAYLPQAAVLYAARGLAGVEPFRSGQLTPAGYRISRLLVAAYGLASLWLLYRIGRLLFDPATALLATLLLSIVPWHLRQSAIFKPDMLLVATTLLALWLALLAHRRGGGSVAPWVLAGAAVGLAMASKLNAAPVAVAVVAGVLALHAGSRRTLALLVAAGATALAMLVLLNPWWLTHPQLLGQDFGNTLELYARRGERAGVSHWALPLHAVATVLGDGMLRPWLGGLALLAIAASLLPFARRQLGHEPGSEQRSGWGMVLAYALAYVVLYSAVTRYPSPHNWLPLAPIACLAAAWGITTVTRALPRVGWRRMATAAAVVLVAWPTGTTARELYVLAVPTTAQVAESYLRRELDPLAQRVVLTDVGLHPSLAGHAVQGRTSSLGRRPPTVVTVSSVAAAGASARDLADAQVSNRPLATPANGGGRLLTIDSCPFLRRGEPLWVLLSPLAVHGSRELAATPTDDPLGWSVTGLAQGSLATLAIAVDWERAAAPLELAIHTGDQVARCRLATRLPRRPGRAAPRQPSARCQTPRLRVDGPITLTTDRPLVTPPRITASLWLHAP